jgi:hypothetical protein
MRLHRMTVRRWILVTLVLAVGMGLTVEGVRLYRRRQEFLHRSRLFAYLETRCREIAKASNESVEAAMEALGLAEREIPQLKPDEPTVAVLKQLLDSLLISRHSVLTATRRAEHCAELKRKYERAAARPWLSVEPDPPDPQ